jgi:cytochrome c556
MEREQHEKTTVTVRLTDDEDEVLRRLCMLKKMSKTGYLARLAKEQAKRELLNYAAEEYLAGKASLSELAKKTGLDVPSIMDEVARIKG